MRFLHLLITIKKATFHYSAIAKMDRIHDFTYRIALLAKATT